MNGVAHISFKGGGLIVPVETPYERELLFEHVEVSTKRHGGVRLRLNSRLWTISLSNGHPEVCGACRQSMDTLTYRFDGESRCARCARRALH